MGATISPWIGDKSTRVSRWLVEQDEQSSVGATNPGAVAQTVHRHESKIEAPTQARVRETKRFEGPTCIPEGPRSNQKSKMSPRERPPLPDRRARQGTRPPPEADEQGTPAGPCRGSRRQNCLTNHSSITHVVHQCGVKPQDD